MVHWPHMRRILFLTVLLAALALPAGWSWAMLSGEAAGRKAPEAAPMHAPAAMPRPDATHDGAYGYRPSTSIARPYEGGADAGAAAPSSGGASATVTVTAVVLPVVTIVAKDGEVQEIWTNTDDRRPGQALFAVREELGGPATELDAETWAAARAALLEARAGTGRIWG